MPVGRCHDIVALLSRARLGSVTMPWHFPTGISKLSQGYLTRAVGWSSIARVTLSSSKHAECEQCFGTPKMNSRAGVLQRRLSQSYLTGVEIVPSTDTALCEHVLSPPPPSWPPSFPCCLASLPPRPLASVPPSLVCSLDALPHPPSLLSPPHSPHPHTYPPPPSSFLLLLVLLLLLLLLFADLSLALCFPGQAQTKIQ